MIASIQRKIYINWGKQELSSYISWGERQVTRKRQKVEAGIPWPKVESVKGRNPGWWSIPRNTLLPCTHFMQYVYSERFIQPYSDKLLISDRCYHRILLKEDVNANNFAATINSIITILSISIGRSGLGEGAIKFETSDAKRLFVVNPKYLDFPKINKFKCGSNIFEECGIDPKSETPIEEQEPHPLPDRAELDNVVFSALDLSSEERKDVYRAVCKLVWNRISKAQSI